MQLVEVVVVVMVATVTFTERKKKYRCKSARHWEGGKNRQIRFPKKKIIERWSHSLARVTGVSTSYFAHQTSNEAHAHAHAHIHMHADKARLVMIKTKLQYQVVKRCVHQKMTK